MRIVTLAAAAAATITADTDHRFLADTDHRFLMVARKDKEPMHSVIWRGAGCSATPIEQVTPSGVCLVASAKHCQEPKFNKNQSIGKFHPINGKIGGLWEIINMTAKPDSDATILVVKPDSIPESNRLPITPNTLTEFYLWDKNKTTRIFNILKETILNEELKIKDSFNYFSKPDDIEKVDWDILFPELKQFIQICPPGVPLYVSEPKIGDRIIQEGYGTGVTGPGSRASKLIRLVFENLFITHNINYFTAGGDSGGAALHPGKKIEALVGTTWGHTETGYFKGTYFSKFPKNLVEYVEQQNNVTILKVDDHQLIQGYENFQFPEVSINFGNTVQVGLPIIPIIKISSNAIKGVVNWFSISENGILQFKSQGDNYTPIPIDEGQRLIVVLNLGFNVTTEDNNVFRAHFTIHKSTEEIQQAPTPSPTVLQNPPTEKSLLIIAVGLGCLTLGNRLTVWYHRFSKAPHQQSPGQRPTIGSVLPRQSSQEQRTTIGRRVPPPQQSPISKEEETQITIALAESIQTAKKEEKHRQQAILKTQQNNGNIEPASTDRIYSI